jgi:hypothetical protein
VNLDRLQDDLLLWSVVRVHLDRADFSNHVYPIRDLSEHRVAVVEVGLGVERDEKLRAVRIGTGIRHRERARRVVAEFVVELVVEGVSGTAAASLGGVAALNHEAFDDAVEGNIVVQWFSTVSPSSSHSRSPVASPTKFSTERGARSSWSSTAMSHG